MALGVVNGIDTDSIDAEILEVLDVTVADGLISERVLVGRGAAGLVVDTAEIEALIALPEGFLKVSTGRIAT